MRNLIAVFVLMCAGCLPDEPDRDADEDGWIAADDCDDSDPDVNPDADEVCNRVDDDCNDLVDDDPLDPAVWFADLDGDGFGDPENTTIACFSEDGWLADNTDCDDTDPALNPATEWYADVDGDGFGNPLDLADTIGCTQPDGYVADDTDCNDSSDAAFPGGTEVCDFFDNDCNGEVDDDPADAFAWYADADGDGFGDDDTSELSCVPPQVGWVDTGGDCDDDDADVNPDTLWFPDSDNDGFAGSDPSVAVQACEGPPGYALDGSDCDDISPDINPAALEVCDGIDNNCDGGADIGVSWDAPWSARLPVTIEASVAAVAAPPIAIDVDFEALLAQAGVPGPFDPANISVVIEDCNIGAAVLPVQYIAGIQGVLDPVESVLPLNTPNRSSKGTVVFQWDPDNDPDTADTLVPGEPVSVGIYYSPQQPGPAPIGDVAVSPFGTSLSNDLVDIELDTSHGALISGLHLRDSPNLGQTAVCCGFGALGDAGWMAPGTTTGTVSVLSSGPLFAMIESLSTPSSADGELEVRVQHMLFAGRPEIWVKVYIEATAETTPAHPLDWTFGVRSWRFDLSALFADADSVVTARATDRTWQDATAVGLSDGSTWGVSVGYRHPPAYLREAYVLTDMVFAGNDIAASGGTEIDLASGTVLLDHAVVLVRPHEDEFQEGHFNVRLDPITVVVGTP